MAPGTSRGGEQSQAQTRESPRDTHLLGGPTYMTSPSPPDLLTSQRPHLLTPPPHWGTQTFRPREIISDTDKNHILVTGLISQQVASDPGPGFPQTSPCPALRGQCLSYQAVVSSATARKQPPRGAWASPEARKPPSLPTCYLGSPHSPLGLGLLGAPSEGCECRMNPKHASSRDTCPRPVSRPHPATRSCHGNHPPRLHVPDVQQRQ